MLKLSWKKKPQQQADVTLLFLIIAMFSSLGTWTNVMLNAKNHWSPKPTIDKFADKSFGVIGSQADIFISEAQDFFQSAQDSLQQVEPPAPTQVPLPPQAYGVVPSTLPQTEIPPSSPPPTLVPSPPKVQGSGTGTPPQPVVPPPISRDSGTTDTVLIIDNDVSPDTSTERNEDCPDGTIQGADFSCWDP